jgi:ubiquitin carboxyl-terminal hydrolase 34
MDDAFLSNTIQHLDKALLNTELMSETFFGPQELQLAAVLVNVLLEFLRGKQRSTLAMNWPISYLQQRDRPPKHPPVTFPTMSRL